MSLIVNGKTEPFTHCLTLEQFVRAKGVAHQEVAIELNGAIVPAGTYAQVQIGDGDSIEIVRFVGGGSA